jgi:manganese/zinc/iron transport system permease protein
MSGPFAGFATLDLMPLLAGLLASVVCAILGSLLVLRRQSLMVDAISHSVLPGLVIAFLLAGTRNTGAMFLGAAVAGVATAALIELVRKGARVEPGAAMGVIFSVLFALGVLLIEQAAARNVDLDASCVLYGQLETLFWLPPAGAPAWSGAWLASIPRQVWTLGGMLVLALLFVGALYKELRAVGFDPAHASSQGIPPGAMHLLLMVLVAGATVAAFEAVGSILVIAMLIVPAATARLLTDRYGRQFALSVAIAVFNALAGYAGGAWLAEGIGLGPVNIAGSITVVSGLVFAASVLVSPRHGVLPGLIRRRHLNRSIALDDLLGGLYRAEERAAGGSRGASGPVVRRALRRGLVRQDAGVFGLTPRGREAARGLIRRHRLWEDFLYREAGLAPDHVHEAAERLEHLQIIPKSGDEEPPIDPHGRPIPPSDRAPER